MIEGEENFVGDSEIIALGGESPPIGNLSRDGYPNFSEEVVRNWSSSWLMI